MTKTLKSIGETLRKLRVDRHLPLRKVAHHLDIDQSFLSKVERNQRQATKEQIIQLAGIYEADVVELLLQYNSDKVVNEIVKEENPTEILKVAEKKISHLSNK